MHTVPVNLSHRHIHITREDCDVLFGAGYQLTVLRDLVQTGEFAANETVDISATPDFARSLTVRIVGPLRGATQCEILQGDTYTLRAPNVPVRLSGDVAGSAPLYIRGPQGTVHKAEGLIVAQRHVHLDPATAQAQGVSQGDVVTITVGAPGKQVTFRDVAIRVKDTFVPECHLDIEEGNAAGIGNGTTVELVV
jgi:putative phosphotransacetylase